MPDEKPPKSALTQFVNLAFSTALDVVKYMIPQMLDCGDRTLNSMLQGASVMAVKLVDESSKEFVETKLNKLFKKNTKHAFRLPDIANKNKRRRTSICSKILCRTEPEACQDAGDVVMKSGGRIIQTEAEWNSAMQRENQHLAKAAYEYKVKIQKEEMQLHLTEWVLRTYPDMHYGRSVAINADTFKDMAVDPTFQSLKEKERHKLVLGDWSTTFKFFPVWYTEDNFVYLHWDTEDEEMWLLSDVFSGINGFSAQFNEEKIREQEESVSQALTACEAETRRKAKVKQEADKLKQNAVMYSYDIVHWYENKHSNATREVLDRKWKLEYMVFREKEMLMEYLKNFKDDLDSEDPYGCRQIGIILSGPGGTGKCFGKDTGLLMYDGTVKLVQDVRGGDLLMGDDSTARRVIPDSVIRGTGRLYKIIPASRRQESFVCNGDHILVLRRRDHPMLWEVSVRDFLQSSWLQQESALLFKPDLVTFDGNSTFHQCCEAVTGYLLTASQVNEIAWQFGVYLSDHSPDQLDLSENPTIQFSEAQFCRLVLLVDASHPSLNQPIPHALKTASKEVRLNVLAGIVDGESGGNERRGENCKAFVEDVEFMCRSLGIFCERNLEGTNISIAGELPIRAGELEPITEREHKECNSYGFTIEEESDSDYYGFTTDGNHRFLLKDFTVTHNTKFVCALANYYCMNVAVVDFTKVLDRETFRLAMKEAIENNMIILFDELDYLIDSMKNSAIRVAKQAQHLEALKTEMMEYQIVKETEKEKYSAAKKRYLQAFEDQKKAPIDEAFFLAILDGIGSQAGRIILATTNNLHKINPLFLRSGRFSFNMTFENFSDVQIKELLSLIYRPKTVTDPIALAMETDSERQSRKEIAAQYAQDLKYLQAQQFVDKLWSPADVVAAHQKNRTFRKTIHYLLTERPSLAGTHSQSSTEPMPEIAISTKASLYISHQSDEIASPVVAIKKTKRIRAPVRVKRQTNERANLSTTSASSSSISDE